MAQPRQDTIQAESARVLFNALIKVPTKHRLEAVTEALKLIRSMLGEASYLYKSLLTMQVCCLVHSRLAELRRKHEKEEAGEDEDHQDPAG